MARTEIFKSIRNRAAERKAARAAENRPEHEKRAERLSQAMAQPEHVYDRALIERSVMSIKPYLKELREQGFNIEVSATLTNDAGDQFEDVESPNFSELKPLVIYHISHPDFAASVSIMLSLGEYNNNGETQQVVRVNGIPTSSPEESAAALKFSIEHYISMFSTEAN